MTPPYSQGRPQDIGVVNTEFGRIAVLICADTFTDAFVRTPRSPSAPTSRWSPCSRAAASDQWPEHSRNSNQLVEDPRAPRWVRCPMAGVDLVGEMTHGPWAGWTYGGSSFVADGTGRILFTARDRDTDIIVMNLPIGTLAKPR